MILLVFQRKIFKLDQSLANTLHSCFETYTYYRLWEMIWKTNTHYWLWEIIKGPVGNYVRVEYRASFHCVTILSQYSILYKILSFILLGPHPRNTEVPGPGIKPASYQWPEPLQWQCWILDPHCITRGLLKILF